MNMKDVCEAGSDIMNAVADAVETNDYSNLSSTIKNRVTDVTVGISKTVADKADQISKQYTGQNMTGRNGGSVHKPAERSGNGQNWAVKNTKPVSYFAQRRVSQVGAIGCIIGGAFGLISSVTLSGVLLGVATVFFSVSHIISLVVLLITVLLMGGFSLLLGNGIAQKKLVSHYYEYARKLGAAEFFSIQEFAARLGCSEKTLRKELQKMMKRGMLRARMDDRQTTVMLTDHAYHQYTEAEATRRAREKEEQLRSEKLDSADVSEDVRDILKEGNAYLKKVHEINDLIPDTEEMSRKIYRLEDIMNRIFDRVEKQPQSAQNLRKFMTYYLPTTLKLLNAYVELDSQPHVGQNIAQTRSEIEDTMDTINDAFEKLLDSLFEDVAWDISSDISVMKTMMAQDGLTRHGAMNTGTVQEDTEE